MAEYAETSEEERATVNLAEVQQLDARAEAITGPLLYRHDWGLGNGRRKLLLNWEGLSRNNQVYVSIHEGNFVGDAVYTVHNVAPRDGGVDIRVNVDWGSPIRLFADYLVM